MRTFQSVARYLFIEYLNNLHKIEIISDKQPSQKSFVLNKADPTVQTVCSYQNFKLPFCSPSIASLACTSICLLWFYCSNIFLYFILSNVFVCNWIRLLPPTFLSNTIFLNIETTYCNFFLQSTFLIKIPSQSFLMLYLL